MTNEPTTEQLEPTTTTTRTSTPYYTICIVIGLGCYAVYNLYNKYIQVRPKEEEKKLLNKPKPLPEKPLQCTQKPVIDPFNME